MKNHRLKAFLATIVLAAIAVAIATTAVRTHPMKLDLPPERTR